MASVNPYVMFNGNCEEAFDFYKSVFGGEFAAKSRFDEAPADQKMGETEGGKIMHTVFSGWLTTSLSNRNK